MVDQSSSMETMIVPLNQVPTQRPVDPADEPTHVTQADSPNWPPPHRQQ
jgi:hypothetical protein